VSAAVSNICPGVPVNSTVYNMDLDTYKQGMVVSPAQCVSLIDSTNCGNYCWASGDYGFVLHYTYGSASPATYGITKHNEGTNFGFVDGHAKWLTPVSVGYTSAQQYDYGPAWTGSLHTGSYGAWTSPAS
jgi:prepilin-type processing-associated H-X9-DG protein